MLSNAEFVEAACEENFAIHSRYWPGECPAVRDAFMERMLSKNTHDRPYDALAVQTELTEILTQSKHNVTEALPQALMAAGASQSATVDPQTGEVGPKKKKVLREI